MIKRLSLLFFWMTALIGLGQSNPLDSLQAVIDNTSEDSTKVLLMLELSAGYHGSAPERAVQISREAQKIATESDYPRGRALALKMEGLAQFKQGEYLQAYTSWQSALDIYREMDDQRGIANMLSNIGAIYYNEQDYNKAVEYYLKSLKVAESVKDTLRISTVLLNIGAVYNDNPAAHDKALEYSNRALKLGRIINDNGAIATSLVNMGEVYFEQGELDKAMEHFQESLSVAEDQDAYIYSVISIGKVLTAQGKYQEALARLNQALQMADEINALPSRTHALINRAETYRAMRQYSRALNDYKEGVQMAKELSSLKQLEGAYEGLNFIYAQANNFDSAYKYQQLYMATKDSIYDIETDRVLNSQMFNFQIEKKEGEISLLKKEQELKELDIRQQKIINALVTAGFISVFVFLIIAVNQKRRIGKEKDRSENLLLNILPREVADELKEKGSSEARQYDEATVLFTDFKDFTGLSERMSARDLVTEINYYFRKFDEIVSNYQIEKIKTIGDAYMAVGGLPIPTEGSARKVVLAALDMQKVVSERKNTDGSSYGNLFEMRIGIHTGPVVAGIVGVKKFQYDIWGDTVNTASRMESSGEIGRVNVSEATHQLLKDDPELIFEERQRIRVKGKGEMTMYFVKRRSIDTPSTNNAHKQMSDQAATKE